MKKICALMALCKPGMIRAVSLLWKPRIFAPLTQRKFHRTREEGGVGNAVRSTYSLLRIPHFICEGPG